MNHSTDPVKPPTPTSLIPVLPAGAASAFRVLRIPEGIIAAFDPTQNDRKSVWGALVDIYGPLTDVTPKAAMFA
jgi:hypothetical protein